MCHSYSRLTREFSKAFIETRSNRDMRRINDENQSGRNSVMSSCQRRSALKVGEKSDVF